MVKLQGRPRRDGACLRRFSPRPGQCGRSRSECCRTFPARPIALDLGQAADAMTLQAPVKGRTGEPRNRGFERIETVVERQQRALAKGDDDGLLFQRQNRRPWSLRPAGKIGHRATFAPLGPPSCPRKSWGGCRAGEPALSGSLDYAASLDGRASVAVALRCKTCPIMPPSILCKSMHHQMPGRNT